ncbi:MAG: hypothetical protein M3343_00865 [Actinomycetota bacterium]|nr:hypothetical protein [Actinomycetota bacterium]
MSELMESKTVVMIGGDLMARSRIEEAARAASLRFVRVDINDLDSLDEPPVADLIVLDLDVGGRALIASWARIAGASGPRVVGYFSHVDVALGDDARAAGIEAVPRGRFWRTLTDTLTNL